LGFIPFLKLGEDFLGWMEGLYMCRYLRLRFSRELSQHSNNSNIYWLAWTGVNTGAYLLGEWGKVEKG
jgi:hypothetical protein